jgi:DNA replication protein DnaD
LDTEHVTVTLFYGHGSIEELKIKEVGVEKGPGHIDFIADNDGAYSVCVEQTDKAATIPSRFKLVINYGYDSEYYEKLSSEQHFDQINMEVHRLNDQMTMILNEADFQKHKEIQYHLQTEKMNSAALWWPMVQIGILVATGILQVQNLKMFFKRNKLI